jgi:hypothetical protein
MWRVVWQISSNISKEPTLFTETSSSALLLHPIYYIYPFCLPLLYFSPSHSSIRISSCELFCLFSQITLPLKKALYEATPSLRSFSWNMVIGQGIYEKVTKYVAKMVSIKLYIMCVRYGGHCSKPLKLKLNWTELNWIIYVGCSKSPRFNSGFQWYLGMQINI